MHAFLVYSCTSPFDACCVQIALNETGILSSAISVEQIDAQKPSAVLDSLRILQDACDPDARRRILEIWLTQRGG